MKYPIYMAFAALMVWSRSLASAEADPDDTTTRLARSYYEKGDAAYNLGRFDDAVGWFTKAYEIWPLPDFLYNIAQSYRQASNCKQALFAYKRYLSLKDKDSGAPLTEKERGDIDRFIKDLSACVAKVDSSAAATPDTLKTTSIPTSATTPPPSMGLPNAARPVGATSPQVQMTSATASVRAPATGAVAPAEGPEDDSDAVISKSVNQSSKLLTAYAIGGIAIFGTGGALDVPVQPSFAAGGGYSMLAGPVILDLGGRASFSPIQYDTMDATKRALFLGLCATAGATYPVTTKISVRGELGLGLAMLRGLVEGNPFTDSRQPGSFTMLSLRIGAAAEYAITSNVSATIAPFSLAFSPMPDELTASSLTQLDVLFGVGYRR